ncbi:MAG: hypothetical protein KF708_18930 [Pirellulales bacterium]|nr:hypothetical protein [Pirellulales bacterium]
MEQARRRRVAMAAIAAAIVLVAIFLLARTTVGRAMVRTYAPWLVPAEAAPAKVAEVPWPESVFDCKPAPVLWVEPGTIVDQGPPADWSHLVMKNDTRVVAGETGKQAENWNKLAEMFSMAALADIGRKENEFFLARIGTGWCHPIDGHDTVISSRTQARQGAKLPALAAIALGVREIECDENTKIVARSASTLFYDVERAIAYGDEHLQARLRYAILVHPHEGKLVAFAWIVPPKEMQDPPAAAIQKLPESFITTFELRFRPKGSGALSMPGADDYAVLRVPQGELPIDVTPELQPIVYADAFDQEKALALEELLREHLGWR